MPYREIKENLYYRRSSCTPAHRLWYVCTSVDLASRRNRTGSLFYFISYVPAINSNSYKLFMLFVTDNVSNADPSGRAV